MSCEEGYIRSRFGARCVEDEQVSLYTDSLESQIIRLLSELKGQSECGKRVPASLTETELREAFQPQVATDAKKANVREVIQRRSQRRLKFDPSLFPVAFSRALASVQATREDDVFYDSATGVYTATKGIYPTRCLLRRFIFRNLRFIILLGWVTVVTLRLWYRRYRNRRYRERVEQVYEAALDLLREVRLHYEDEGKGEAFMGDTQLREEILGRTTEESVELWSKAEALLRADSRVLRTGPKTIRGLPTFLYEWRGHLVRSSLGSGSRERRASFNGPDSESRRRLSFGSATRRLSSSYDAATPQSSANRAGTPGVDQRRIEQSPMLSRVIDFLRNRR